MKLSELVAILELSKLSHPGNNVLACVLNQAEIGERHARFAHNINVDTVRDLVPNAADWSGSYPVLMWEPD